MKPLALALLALAACGRPADTALPTTPAAPGSPAPVPSSAMAAVDPGPTMPAPVASSPDDHVRVLRDVITTVALTLDETTVRCSALGYGTRELKVAVPDLAWLAHFDHRSGGEGLPCMTAGECTDARSPALLLDGGPAVTTAPLRVRLVEHLLVDPAAQACTRQLEEQVASEVDGVAFSHARAGDAAPLDWAVCQALRAL